MTEVPTVGLADIEAAREVLSGIAIKTPMEESHWLSTLTGARGLGAEFRNGLRVVPDHDHDAFADHVIRLSKDAGLRRSLGLEAFADAQRWNERQLAALDHCLRGDALADVAPGPHAPRRDRWPAPRSTPATPTAA